MKCAKCKCEASFMHRIPGKPSRYWCLKCAEPEEGKFQSGSVYSMTAPAAKVGKQR